MDQLIEKRFSPREFSDKPIPEDHITTLLEAAQWAPSSYNEQPWRFIYATKDSEKEYATLYSCLGEFNQNWVNTPLLLLTVAKLKNSRGDNNDYAEHDCGLALENLLLEAVSLGLHAHAMSGYDREKAKTLLGIPEGYKPMAMVAVGYLKDGKTIEELREGRERKPLNELVFKGTWSTD
ncbi:nitroreductase family protein [Candidatus Dojkabacteria bacterium]|uniref:Nitroreductase family protein n=1 Tax=Candidatus Dojkabacteria bacterium TaxID=2099670 RepID=A0A955L9U3_9BACT|nr:nitroreductase family protein [Candidatus Dojkabacteria bacterium]